MRNLYIKISQVFLVLLFSNILIKLQLVSRFLQLFDCLLNAEEDEEVTIHLEAKLLN